MDLVVFENNKPFVIDEFREGRFDYVEPAVPAERESGLKIGKNGRRLRKEVNTGISSSVIMAGWRFASQDGNSVLGEKSRRDPVASARTTHSAERKHLSADALYALLRLEFDKIADHRGRECPISLPDALMSAFSLFALKDPSLLAFEERCNDANMGNLFGVAASPRTRSCGRSWTPWSRGVAALVQRGLSPTPTRKSIGAVCVL